MREDVEEPDGLRLGQEAEGAVERAGDPVVVARLEERVAQAAGAGQEAEPGCARGERVAEHGALEAEVGLEELGHGADGDGVREADDLVLVSRAHLGVCDEHFGAAAGEQAVHVHAVVVHEELVGHLHPPAAEHVARDSRDRAEAPVDHEQVCAVRERLDHVAAERAPVQHEARGAEAVARELEQLLGVFEHVLQRGAAAAVSVAAVVPEEAVHAAAAVELDGLGLVGEPQLVEARVRQAEERDGRALQLAGAARGQPAQLGLGDAAERLLEQLVLLQELRDEARAQRQRVCRLVAPRARHQQVAVEHRALRRGHLHAHARVLQAALQAHLVQRAEGLSPAESQQALQQPRAPQARRDLAAHARAGRLELAERVRVLVSRAHLELQALQRATAAQDLRHGLPAAPVPRQLVLPQQLRDELARPPQLRGQPALRSLQQPAHPRLRFVALVQPLQPLEPAESLPLHLGRHRVARPAARKPLQVHLHVRHRVYRPPHRVPASRKPTDTCPARASAEPAPPPAGKC